jgi:hypothetical protein
MAGLLSKPNPVVGPAVHWVSAIGYACVAGIGVFGMRVGRLYLQLDQFRVDLFEALIKRSLATKCCAH